MTRIPNLCAALYLAFALPLLAALALITPPWQNPDEPLHVARIVQIAHGGLIGSRAYGTAGGWSDRAVYDAYKPVAHAAMHPAQRLSGADLQASRAVQWTPQLAYTSFPNTAQYPPMFYLPGAAAYWAGRAGHLSIDRTLILIRLANAILFACIAAIALKLAQRTRPLLAAILLLPTTLSLACAAGQDSLLFATTALSVALLDRIITAQRPATRPESLLIAALLACVAAARPPYAGFLLALLLLDPKPTARTLRVMAVSAALVLAWCLAVAVHVTVKLGGADITRQLAFISANPGEILPIIAHTVRLSAWPDWQQIIGVLGWTDTILPTSYIFGQTCVLGAAAAACAGITRLKWAPAAGAVFAVLAIFVLQFLTWTWPGQLEITGVLGRYFIPTSLMLALALPGRATLSPRVAWAAIALAAITTPTIMVHAILARYTPT